MKSGLVLLLIFILCLSAPVYHEISSVADQDTKDLEINYLHLFSDSEFRQKTDLITLTGIMMSVEFSDDIIFKADREIRMTFSGSIPTQPVLINEEKPMISGFLIPGAQHVVYYNIYPSIDLVFSLVDGIFKSSFIIHVEADYRLIMYKYLSFTEIPIRLSEDNLIIGDYWRESGLILTDTTNSNQIYNKEE
ncbi:MAG: hypothetical protein INQ03_11245 [Candidatus Heimdallarchaeota archaeon]|nr:hypothetical protein [Candidatus Heimdallarchaeota archaeon]